jgi:mannose-6-phosphate isomerase-like protein (cupin superfamily)
MKVLELRHLLDEHQRTGRSYLEFLRADTLSMGLYALPAGAVDRQQPHAENEVYYVLQGRARFKAGDEDRAVEPGTLLFVPAHQPHRFHGITEDLTLLVFFAPAESLPEAGAGSESSP